MKSPLYPTRVLNRTRDGYHVTSPYWQAYKNALPPRPQDVFEVVFGMALGDAGITRVNCREARMKFEQGAKQRDFLFHVFHTLRSYCFMEHPGIRYTTGDPLHIRSYWFNTFSHPSFTRLFTLFYRLCPGDSKKYKKVISEGLIRDFLTPRAFAYWIMCDGYLHQKQKILTLHTEGFTHEENQIASRELNHKFG